MRLVRSRLALSERTLARNPRAAPRTSASRRRPAHSAAATPPGQQSGNAGRCPPPASVARAGWLDDAGAKSAVAWAAVTGAASRNVGPVSATTRPSTSSIRRQAHAATSGSCVMTTTVWPRSAKSRSTVSTSVPFSASSAPVGSSASSTCPPFIKARPMATRCCSPPDKADGRWRKRCPKPRDLSNVRARSTRSARPRRAYNAGNSTFSSAVAEPIRL